MVKWIFEIRYLFIVFAWSSSTWLCRYLHLELLNSSSLVHSSAGFIMSLLLTFQGHVIIIELAVFWSFSIHWLRVILASSSHQCWFAVCNSLHNSCNTCISCYLNCSRSSSDSPMSSTLPMLAFSILEIPSISIIQV